MQEEKEQDKVGEAGNPVSLSQGFGGVMGSKTEKVCWRKFMMLHKTQKPTLTLLKRKVGWERLSYLILQDMETFPQALEVRRASLGFRG